MRKDLHAFRRELLFVEGKREGLMDDRLTAVLRALLPRKMADDLDAHGGDAEFVAHMMKLYLTADPAAQADMEDFHESDGVALVEDAHARLEERATPSSQELSEWLAD